MQKNSRRYDVRDQAVQSLVKIEREGAYSNLETREVLSRDFFVPSDRGLYLALVYGTLQNKAWIDWMLAQVADRPIKKLNEIVLMILRTAIFQILFLDRIPDYAVVDEAVKTAGRLKKQAKNFINGVLRNFIRQKETLSAFDLNQWDNEKEGLAIRYSVSQRIVFQYFEAFGDEKAMVLIPLMNEAPPLTIRVNTLKTTREKLMMELKKETTCLPTAGLMTSEAIHMQNASGLDILHEIHFQAGEYIIQDQGAMLLTHLLDPQPGEVILDMCAAPGGKTTHIAQLMRNEGEIYARDIYDSRLALVKASGKRLGIDIIRTENVDGTILSPIDLEFFDRILLDAPCSGTGIIRRKPEIRYRVDKKERRELRRIQALLIDNAVQMLKHGGTMVYSTCTADKEENNQQIEKMLIEHPAMHIVPGTMGYTDPSLDGCDCFFHCKLIKD